MNRFAEFIKARMSVEQNEFDLSIFDDIAIKSRRGPEFFNKAQELSDYIRDLNLPKDKNDRLVALMTEMTTIAEKHALMQGVGMCIGDAADWKDVFVVSGLKS